MSESNQSDNADGIRSYSWMFNARLQIAEPHNTPTLIPAKYFEDILDNCSEYQTNVLKHMETISFSYNPDWSHMLPGAPLQVTGLVVNKNAVRKDVLADWLVHELLEIEWFPIIGRRDKHERVAAFLKESALREDFLAVRAGGAGDPSATKLRVDCIGPSAPTSKLGRPAKKRPQPEQGFGAVDGGVPGSDSAAPTPAPLAAAAPGPASTTAAAPSDAAAASAGGQSEPGTMQPEGAGAVAEWDGTVAGVPSTPSRAAPAPGWGALSTPSTPAGHSNAGSVFTGASTPSSTRRSSPGSASGSTGASTPASCTRRSAPGSDTGARTPSSIGRSSVRPASSTGASTPASWQSTGWSKSPSGHPDVAQRMMELELKLAAREMENKRMKLDLEKKDSQLQELRLEKRRSADMHRKRRSRAGAEATLGPGGRQ